MNTVICSDTSKKTALCTGCGFCYIIDIYLDRYSGYALKLAEGGHRQMVNELQEMIDHAKRIVFFGGAG